jgi:hypothetical protein
MNRNAIYIRVLLVLIALVVLLAFWNRAPRRSSGDSWLPSTFNPVGAGTMAFYQTLHDLNWPVERWREPLSRLSHYGTGNVLIITRSPAGARATFSEQEAALLDQWTAHGNTLVLLGALGEWDDTRELLRQLGFVLGTDKGQNPLSILLHPLEPSSDKILSLPPVAGSDQAGLLEVPPAPPLPIPLPAGTRVLRQDSTGLPFLVEFPDGKGRVVCGASSYLLDNTFLPRGDNLAIVLGLLAPGGNVPRHVFFEESHHGFTTIFALARLLEHPGVRFGGMLAVLGLLAFISSALIRFGPVVPWRRTSGRSTLEFVDSVADLYRRADLRNDTINYLYRETHQRVLERLHLPPTADHSVIAARLKEAHPHLPSWKKLAHRFNSTDYIGGLPPSGWMRVARDLIEIKSAMA